LFIAGKLKQGIAQGRIFHYIYTLNAGVAPRQTTPGQAVDRASDSFGLKYIAGVAQLVEQLIRNQQVRGSSPLASSKQGPVEIQVLFIF
jgi:hypothetical protein